MRTKKVNASSNEPIGGDYTTTRSDPVAHITDIVSATDNADVEIGKLVDTIGKLKNVINDKREYKTARNQIADLLAKDLETISASDEILNQLTKIKYPEEVKPSDAKYLAKTLVVSEFAAKHFPPFITDVTYGAKKVDFDSLAIPVLTAQIVDDVDPDIIPMVWSKHSEIVKSIDWKTAKVKFIVIAILTDLAKPRTIKWLLDEIVRSDNYDSIIGDTFKLVTTDPHKFVDMVDDNRKAVFKAFDRYIDKRLEKAHKNDDSDPFARFVKAHNRVLSAIGEEFSSGRIFIDSNDGEKEE